MKMSKKPDQLVIVLTTESSFSNANSLIKTILNRRLAACASLREVESSYWWEGKIEKNQEIQILIKTTEKRLKDLLKGISELHSYETPELVYWKISANREYENWVEESTCL